MNKKCDKILGAMQLNSLFSFLFSFSFFDFQWEHLRFKFPLTSKLSNSLELLGLWTSNNIPMVLGTHYTLFNKNDKSLYIFPFKSVNSFFFFFF